MDHEDFAERAFLLPFTDIIIIMRKVSLSNRIWSWAV